MKMVELCDSCRERANYEQRISTLDNMVKRREEIIDRQRALIQSWQGKCAVLKHENNKLRAKGKAVFQTGRFTLASGQQSFFKIEAGNLTRKDLETVALQLAARLPPYSAVEGVPTGGLRLAKAMERYAFHSPSKPLLIVGDVLTTGASMEKQRGGRDAIGAVIFARTQDIPEWITPLFALSPFKMGPPNR